MDGQVTAYGLVRYSARQQGKGVSRARQTEWMEKVVARIQKYIDHSRFLTSQSAQMLRKAVVLVASRKAEQAALTCPPGSQAAFDSWIDTIVTRVANHTQWRVGAALYGTTDPLTQEMARQGVISTRVGAAQLLELQFDGGRQGASMDFQPHLPLLLHW